MSDQTIFFTLGLSSVLKLIVQESRPVFLALEQNPTPPHGDCLLALVSPTVMSCFSTELQGKTLKLQRRRGQASGNCKTSSQLLVTQITNVSLGSSHPSLSISCFSFSRLFSSSSSSTSSNTARGLPSNVKYNPPSIMKKSNTFSQFPREKSKAFDFLKEE